LQESRLQLDVSNVNFNEFSDGLVFML